MKALELKIPPVLLVIICVGLMWQLSGHLPVLALGETTRKVLYLLFAGSGAVLLISGVTSFFKAGTTVNPHSPDSAKILVINGFYRITRNPMYLGMLLMLIAWAVFLSSLFSLALVAVFVELMNRHLEIAEGLVGLG